MYMGKKSRKEKKDKPIEYYTTTEKYDEISRLVTKLNILGLGVYENEMKELDMISNQYINENIECQKTINLTGSKRKMDVKFINNKKYPISVNLLYDAGV